MASFVGNNQLGPDLALGLIYSPLNDKNSGFGTGFSCGITQFDKKSSLLELSNGEKYKVIPGSDIVINKKLNNFSFSYTNGNDDSDGYTIVWKEGKRETLILVGENTFVLTALTSPLGYVLTLTWDWNGQYPLLSRIDDETTVLCRCNYGIVPEMTIWPDLQEEYRITFELLNDDQLDAVTRRSADGETLTWRFGYDAIEGGNSLLLTGVTYPTGMTDYVTYSLQQGLRFPDAAGDLARLPAVLSHTRNPGGGQPETLTYYAYTEHNFLGYNGDFGDWSADSDYLYTTLTDYVYGSTATVISDNVTVTTEYIYNNYHLQIAEEVQRRDCRYRTEMTYYAVPYTFIDAQPPQFQLPMEKTETWSDAQGSRSQVTLTEFDIHGNPTREVAPDGTETLTTWYPASGEDGCPAEPNGFVRFMKSQTIIPPQTGYDAPQQNSQYTYTRLGGTTCVVQESQSDFWDNVLLQRRNTSYCSEPGANFGRITAIIDTLFDAADRTLTYSSTQAFSTEVSDSRLVQTVTFTGHDKLQVSTVSEQSSLSGALLREIDAQGISKGYTYDGLGRILSCTLCPGTEYESTTTWGYRLADGLAQTIETAPRGNATRTGFDGSGRQVCQEKYDADTSGEWYEVQSAVYNVLGENIAINGSDWITHVGTPAEKINLTSQHVYDGWGNTSRTVFNDGTATLQHVCPIQLTSLRSLQGSQGRSTQSSGKILTHYDLNGHLVSESSIDASGKEVGRRTYAYDGLGRLRHEMDELGNVTQYTYDLRGRVASQTLPDGSKVTRTYAPYLISDSVTSITVSGPDAHGNRKTWLLGTQSFDSLGRLTRSISGGRTTVFAYEGAAPVPSSVTTPAEDILYYTCIPELGYVTSRLTGEGIKQTFEYDLKTGLPVYAQEESGVGLTQTWTPAGHLATEKRSGTEGGDRWASYRWSLAGQVVSYTDIAGKIQRYVRDECGRIIAIEDDALSVALTYDALGRPVSQKICATDSSSQLDTAFTYDDFGREISRTVTDSTGVQIGITQRWRANGQLAERVTLHDGQPVRTESYQYDERNRLIGYAASGSRLVPDGYGHPVSAQAWSYDALNNLTTVITTLEDGSADTATYHYGNPADPTQLTSVTHSHAGYPATLTLEYDANGRLTRDEAGRMLRYDVTGRLIAVSDSEGSGGIYGYDALNRLVSQRVDGANEHELYYRGDELVNEVIASQGHNGRFIKLGHRCLGMQDGNGLTLIAGDQHESLLWSRHTEESGQLHGWTPYGNGEAPALLPGFNGERRDPVSGTYHLGNGYRAYNPVLMRFNCPDSLSPFGAGGINPYAYCLGDPVNRIDPTGHISWQGVLGIGLGILGLIGAAFTGGSSIAAAGGVMAAINSASSVALVVGTLGVASDVAAIATGATENAAPEASGILGWVSMATGIAGFAAGGRLALSKGTQRLRNRLGNIKNTGLSGRGATSAARSMAANQNQTVPRLTTLAGKALSDRARESRIFDNLALPIDVYSATHDGQMRIINQLLRGKSNMKKMNSITNLFLVADELGISKKVLNEFYEVYESLDMRTTFGRMNNPGGKESFANIVKNNEGIPQYRLGYDLYTEKGRFFIWNNLDKRIPPADSVINELKSEYNALLKQWW